MNAAAGAVVLLCIAGLLGYIASLYNSLVQVKNNIEKAWKNIDVLLQQRHDELPKLVDACQGSMEHERDVLERITKLRADYNEVRNLGEKTRVENELNRALGRLNIALKAYPDLKAGRSFLRLQQRISALESSIADRRVFFNDSVNIYNIHIQRFPEILIVKPLGYRLRALLEIPEDVKKDARIVF